MKSRSGVLPSNGDRPSGPILENSLNLTVETSPPRPPRPAPACVGAVFVTFHPDPGIYQRVLAVAPQVREILIVDNGSAEDELTPLNRLMAEGVAASIMNGANLGLAVALNQGVAWGEDRGLDWVVTFDQDTDPGPSLIEEAGLVFAAHTRKPPAVIGAGWVSSPDLRPDCDDAGGVEVACVITSGTLHSVSVWRALGGFRDDFFVDYVDTEYCLRARAAGYLVARACRLTMSHTIGRPTKRRAFFRSVTPSNHNRMRRYFITRNRIRVWKQYGRLEPRYVRFDIRASLKELLKLVVYEDDRPAKLAAIARGAWDGLFQREDPTLLSKRRSDG